MAKSTDPEYIPPDLVPTIGVSRASGMWPPVATSYRYYLFSAVVFFGIGVGCPLTQLINMIFVESLNDVVDQCLISITMISSAWKGYNLFMQCDRLREIFVLHREMLQLSSKLERDRFDILARNNVRLFYFFIGMYMCGWTGVCFQTFFSAPEKRLWPSTYFFPFEFTKNNYVYLTVLIYQGVSEVLFCIWNALQDTYPIAMILMLSEHIDHLLVRLVALGRDETDAKGKKKMFTNAHHYEQLKNCCIYYEKCLRFWKLLEESVSMAFLFQFGASGFVICTSAYQLSIINPAYISKLIFVVVYFMCMITQVLVPSFYGSMLLHKSMGMTRAIYMSEWIERDAKYKKAFQIFVSRTFRPMTIYAAGVFLLSLPTFVSICRTAYSMFALLKRIEK